MCLLNLVTTRMVQKLKKCSDFYYVTIVTSYYYNLVIFQTVIIPSYKLLVTRVMLP